MHTWRMEVVLHPLDTFTRRGRRRTAYAHIETHGSHLLQCSNRIFHRLHGQLEAWLDRPNIPYATHAGLSHDARKRHELIHDMPTCEASPLRTGRGRVRAASADNCRPRCRSAETRGCAASWVCRPPRTAPPLLPPPTHPTTQIRGRGGPISGKGTAFVKVGEGVVHVHQHHQRPATIPQSWR